MSPRFLSLTVLSALITLVGSGVVWAQDPAEHGVPTGNATHAAVEHGATGLPQLDIATFPGQLFWLLVTGVTLYVLMAKFALPKVEGIMRARDDFVHDHLHRAADLRHQAEAAKIDYDRTVQQAEKNAKDFLAQTIADQRTRHDAALQETLSRIAARVAETETRLQADRQQIMQSVDQKAAALAGDIMLTVFETKPSAF